MEAADGLYTEEGRKEITLLGGGGRKRSVARSRLVSKTEVGRRRRRKREHIYARTDYPPQAFPLIGSIMETRALIGFPFLQRAHTFTVKLFAALRKRRQIFFNFRFLDSYKRHEELSKGPDMSQPFFENVYPSFRYT